MRTCPCEYSRSDGSKGGSVFDVFGESAAVAAKAAQSRRGGLPLEADALARRLACAKLRDLDAADKHVGAEERAGLRGRVGTGQRGAAVQNVEEGALEPLEQVDRCDSVVEGELGAVVHRLREPCSQAIPHVEDCCDGRQGT